MGVWLNETVKELSAASKAAVIDDFYARGGGGWFRLIFEPKGTEVWVDDGDGGWTYTRPHDVVKFGHNARIGVEPMHFEWVYGTTEPELADALEDWETEHRQFYPERHD